MESSPSAAPSSTITFPPPPPSSAGWKRNLTVPFSRSLIPHSAWAAPTSMLVCPSWPQACILPSISEANGKPVSSWIGRASMSALKPTVGPSPSPLKVATIPFSATPVCTSSGRPSRAESTFSAVFFVPKPSSGSRWMSLLRATILSPKPARTSSFRSLNFWATLNFDSSRCFFASSSQSLQAVAKRSLDPAALRNPDPAGRFVGEGAEDYLLDAEAPELAGHDGGLGHALTGVDTGDEGGGAGPIGYLGERALREGAGEGSGG